MRGLPIRQQIILLLLSLNVTLTAVLSTSMYRNERAAILRETDEKLLAGATGIIELFPEDYHARIAAGETIQPAEYLSYAKRLTTLARKNSFQRLSTYMERDGRIVTTAMSAEPNDPSTVLPFLTVYRLPSAGIRKAFAERTTVFDAYTDEFGPTLSAFVPTVTPNGQVFVADADVSSDFIDSLLRAALWRVIILSVIVFAGFVVVSIIVADRIARPIGALARVTTSMSERAFELTDDQARWLMRIAERARGEVPRLASAFLQMEVMLKAYVTDLRETTAAKEAIESELNIARTIQNSFLQKIFPAFPDRTEFDLAAALDPAKEVGGDLYDFALMGDELYFCIGDVSGKGVPAALMMVVTLTLTRAAAQQPRADPAAMLARVSADILEKNDALMFVTMFCGVLAVSTGELRYSNAGHNVPLVRRGDGSVEWLKLPVGLPLGVDEDAAYTTSTIRLGRGDTLLVYTDGVTEADNGKAELFGDEALRASVVGAGDQPPQDLIASVMRSVKAHMGRAPQSDDITMLALRWNG